MLGESGSGECRETTRASAVQNPIGENLIGDTTGYPLAQPRALAGVGKTPERG